MPHREAFQGELLRKPVSVARGANRHEGGGQQHRHRATVERLEVVHEHAACDNEHHRHRGRRRREAGGHGSVVVVSEGAGRLLGRVHGHVQPKDGAARGGPQHGARGAAEVA